MNTLSLIGHIVAGAVLAYVVLMPVHWFVLGDSPAVGPMYAVALIVGGILGWRRYRNNPD